MINAATISSPASAAATEVPASTATTPNLYRPDLETLTVDAVTGMFAGRNLIYGFTPADATSIQIELRDLPTLGATIHSGIFATCVPTDQLDLTATAHAVNRAGTTIAVNSIQFRPAPSPPT